MGLKASQIRIIARLDPLYSRFQMLVTPFVGVIPHQFEPVINKDEVESVFRLPIDHFLDPSRTHHEAYEFTDSEEVRRGHAFYAGDHRIYGLTCEFLIHFLDESKVRPLPFEWHIPGKSTWFQRSMNMRPELASKL